MPIENPDALAGTASMGVPPPLPDTAREVYPVSFEKDDLDFRGIPVEDEPVVPKASSAPVSVATQASVTGLEDVSTDDLDKNAQVSAAKVTTLPTASGL